MMPKRALVLGATGGIGNALSSALSSSGAQVFRLSRSDGLDWMQPELAEETLLAAPGPFDLVFDATGALVIDGSTPEKKLAAIDAATMAAQFAVNAIGPALVTKHYETLLPEGRPSVLATLSARVGSIEDNNLGGWIAYRAAKAGLNQIIRTAAIEIRRKRPEAVCVALHPGTVLTDLSAPVVGRGAGRAVTAEVSAHNLLNVISNLEPDDTGGFFAYDGSRIPW